MEYFVKINGLENGHGKLLRKDHTPKTKTRRFFGSAERKVFALPFWVCAQQMQCAGDVLTPLAAEDTSVIIEKTGLHFLGCFVPIYVNESTFLQPGLHAVIVKPQAQVRIFGHILPARQQNIVIAHMLPPR